MHSFSVAIIGWLRPGDFYKVNRLNQVIYKVNRLSLVIYKVNRLIQRLVY